jgi:hypothetical protein
MPPGLLDSWKGAKLKNKIYTSWLTDFLNEHNVRINTLPTPELIMESVK